MLPASLLSSSGGGRTVAAAAAARAGADSEGREAPAPLAPGVLRFDPLDIALFLGVAALLYRYAMAGTDGAVGHMDASLLDI